MVTISLFKKSDLTSDPDLTSERGEGVKGEVKNISLHWLQGIFETVPYYLADSPMHLSFSGDHQAGARPKIILRSIPKRWPTCE